MTESVPNKTPAIISVILTIILLIAFDIFSFLVQLLALNGYSEKEGGAALIVFGICQVVWLILSALLSWWLTNFLIKKYNWNKTLTVIVSILASTFLGAGLWNCSVIMSVMAAEGIR